MTKKFNLLALLFFALMTGGIISISFGKELCWDLANYHFYVPFAFLHSRKQDFWPNSFIHQFINPTIDFLTYFLIIFIPPKIAEFVLGAIHGINFWLLFLIANFFVQGKYRFYICLLLSALGMYGPTVWTGIGSFQNDNLVSIFVLSALFLYLKNSPFLSASTKAQVLHESSGSVANIITLSGLLLGIGVGLKLTCTIYLIGLLISIVLSPITLKKRFVIIIHFSFVCLIGIGLSAGYWMLDLWQQHHNPFFPMFNAIFKSPDFLNINWFDKRFLPKDILEIFFFPYYFSWYSERISDAPFQDFRFFILHFLFLITLCLYGLNKHSKLFSSIKFNLTEFTLCSFFISSYLVWQTFFSIARYLAPLEMLAPLLIYLLITKLIQSEIIKSITLTIIFYSLVFFMIAMPPMRTPWFGKDFFAVRLPDLTKVTNATVLVAYPAYVSDLNPRPQSYLIPFFPTDWKFIGISFLHGKYFFDPQHKVKILSKLATEKNILLLTSDENMPELINAARELGLKKFRRCEKVLSDRQLITNQDTLLCEVKG